MSINRFRFVVVSLFVVSLFLTPGLSRAAVDIFLKIPGIDGEVTAIGHENWIQVYSYSSGLVHPYTVGQPGTTPPSFSDISIQKPLDKASPRIYLAVATAEVFTSGTLEVVESATNIVLTRIDLTNMVLTSASTGGAYGGGVPVESVSMAFSKIKWTYNRIGPAGGIIETITTQWDLTGGTVLSANGLQMH